MAGLLTQVVKKLPAGARQGTTTLPGKYGAAITKIADAVKKKGTVPKAATSPQSPGQTAPADQTTHTIQPVTPVLPPGTDTTATIPGGETENSQALPAASAPPAAPAPDPFGPEPTAADTSVTKQMTKLLGRSNEYMQQAEAQGLKSANRRGLINSTAAVRAVEAERIRAAMPLASQEAGQAHQTLMARLDRTAQDRIARMNVAASERQAASQLAAGFEQTYAQTMAAIMGNPDMPGNARRQYTNHAGKVRDSNLALVEQMYGIQLDWGGGGSGSGGGTSGSGSPVLPAPLPEKAKQAKKPTNPKKGAIWVDLKTNTKYVYTGRPSLSNKQGIAGIGQGWEIVK